MSEKPSRGSILESVKTYAAEKLTVPDFVPGESVIPVSGKVLTPEDFVALVDASLDGWLTAGRFHTDFERALAKYVGSRSALFVNSGSSANLVALSGLTSPKLGKRALKPGDEVVSASLVRNGDELLLVSKKAMSLRFTTDDESLRSMGRSTSGVIGMKFREGDQLLTMSRVDGENSFVFTATDGGYGKKTPIEEYRLQGRGGIGIKAAKIDEDSRGSLVSALVLVDTDEILAITSAGTVMRTQASEIRQTGRDSMGVRLVNLDEGATLLTVTRSREDEISEEK